jgi:hypothetical protein
MLSGEANFAAADFECLAYTHERDPATFNALVAHFLLNGETATRAPASLLAEKTVHR